jgi:hypothetical protein
MLLVGGDESIVVVAVASAAIRDGAAQPLYYMHVHMLVHMHL